MNFELHLLIHEMETLSGLSLPSGLSKAAVRTDGWALAASCLTGPCLSLTCDHPDTVAG